MPDDVIRAVTHPQGDWFKVTIAREHEAGDRWFIDRVVLWALRSGDQVVDHVSAVDSTGVPDAGDPLQDRFFVLGTDACPDGRPWNEVYHSVRPSPVMVREISEQGKTWGTQPT